MSDLFERVLDPQTVQAAWRRLRSDRAPWAHDVTREELDAELPRHLLQLIADLRDERYRPAALRQFTVARGDGKKRVISAQFLRDKVAQRMVLEVLEAEIDPLLHPDSFGYRRGRGVPHAIAKVRERIATGLRWVVDGDIRSFFDRVPHRGINRAVAEFVPDRALRRLIKRWIAASPHPGGLLSPAVGVPQGAVLSPMLCNLFLDQLDTAWTRAGIPFVRYADDFVLLTPNQNDAERARDFTERQLRRLRLELHPDKTQIARASTSLRFLGEPIVKRRWGRS